MAVSERQVSRMWAIAYSSAKSLGLSAQDVSDKVASLLRKYEVEDPEELKYDDYNAICNTLEEWGDE